MVYIYLTTSDNIERQRGHWPCTSKTGQKYSFAPIFFIVCFYWMQNLSTIH